MKKAMAACFLLLGSMALCDLQLLYYEGWNNAQTQSNFWFYFSANGIQPAPWRPAKGVGGSPYLQMEQSFLFGSPLQTSVAFTFSDYHPINLYDPHEIHIWIRLCNDENPDVIVDTAYASVEGFWIAQVDPNDSTRATAYLSKRLFSFDQNWKENVFSVSRDISDWITIKNDLNLTPAQILPNPQIYGFSFYPPTQNQWIGIDEFAVYGVVPEPATAVLLGLGLLATARRRTR